MGKDDLFILRFGICCHPSIISMCLSVSFAAHNYACFILCRDGIELFNQYYENSIQFNLSCYEQ